MPAVHSAIRTACHQLGVYKYATTTATGAVNKTPFEFCTAVNPDEVVTEGLAIQGAILSGVTDSSTLKNVLMMDCLAMSIGLLSWKEDSSGSDNNAHSDSRATGSEAHTAQHRVFEPILHKGEKIPSKGSKKFALGAANQRFVSLDMYEQIDQQRLVAAAHIVESAESNVGADVEVKSGKQNKGSKGSKSTSVAPTAATAATTTEYTYSLIATADVPIPPRTAKSSGNATSSRLIEVVFRIDEHGQLSYEVLDCDEQGNSISHSNRTDIQHIDAEADPASSTASFYLIAYIALMFLLYVAVKVLLVEAEVTANGSSAIGDEEVAAVVTSAVEAVAGKL